MKAGRLTETITIDRETETVSPAGTVTTTWSTIATRKAEVIQATTAEFMQAFGEDEQTAIVFRCRYVGDVVTSDRITFRGQAYNLKEVKEIGRRRGLELRCERVST